MFIEHPGLTKDERINLYQLIVARSDITEALFTTRLFLKEVHDMSNELYFPLQDSIITSYSRPFKRSEPHGTLKRDVWPGFSDPSLQKVHYLLIRQRDKSVAHADSNFRKVRILPKGTSVAPNYPLNEELGVEVSASKLELGIFPKIEKTCQDLGQRLNNAIEAELERMYGNMNLPKTAFDLLDSDE